MAPAAGSGAWSQNISAQRQLGALQGVAVAVIVQHPERVDQDLPVQKRPGKPPQTRNEASLFDSHRSSLPGDIWTSIARHDAAWQGYRLWTRLESHGLRGADRRAKRPKQGQSRREWQK